MHNFHISSLFSPQTGERSGQVEKSKKNARQRQNDFKVCFDESVSLTTVFQINAALTCWRAVCFVENDRRDDPSAGEAHSGGPSPHHPATGRTESLWRLGDQDGAHWSLADPNHTHCQVLRIRSNMCLIDYEPFITWLHLAVTPPMPLFPRGCHEALSALEIPNDLLQVIQDLLLELRVHCLMVTLLHTTDGEGGLCSQEL